MYYICIHRSFDYIDIIKILKVQNDNHNSSKKLQALALA